MTTQNNTPATLQEFQAEITRHSMELCGETPEQLGTCTWEEDEVGDLPVFVHTCKHVCGGHEEIKYFKYRSLWFWQCIENKTVLQGFGVTLEDAI